MDMITMEIGNGLKVKVLNQLDIPKLFGKLAKVSEKVESVPKNGYNHKNDYKFIKEEDLVKSIRNILLQEKLVFLPPYVVEESEDNGITKVVQEFSIADIETGATITTRYVGKGKEESDKGVYKAYTGALKYFLRQTFLFSTGDDPEKDSGKNPDKKSDNKSDEKNDSLTEKQKITIKNNFDKVRTLFSEEADINNLTKKEATEIIGKYIYTEKSKNSISKNNTAQSSTNKEENSDKDSGNDQKDIEHSSENEEDNHDHLKKATRGQVNYVGVLVKNMARKGSRTEEQINNDIIKHYNVNKINDITRGEITSLIDRLKKGMIS